MKLIPDAVTRFLRRHRRTAKPSRHPGLPSRAERPKLLDNEDVRVLRQLAASRYGFCPRHESCGGCHRCDDDWHRLQRAIDRLTEERP